MKLEKFKEKKKLKIRFIIIGCICLISIGYLVSKSYAVYQERKDFNLMEGTFDYYQDSDVSFAFYNGDTIVDTIPSKDSGVVYNSSKSNCTNGASIVWNNDTWEPTIQNLTKTKTKCTLYFD